MPSRRDLLLGMAVLGGGALLPRFGLAATVPPSAEIPFTVYRNGDSPMGSHRLRFRREGERLIMEKEIAFEVTLAFITAYRYRHTNREVWEAGRLVSIETRTDDDGKAFWVRGAATADGFAVDSSSGPVLAPADIIPTSYWNVATLRATQLLDTQRGLLMDVRLDDRGQETIEAGGAAIQARHHTIQILTNKPGATDAIEIWYDSHDSWVKLAFAAKGQDIAYVLDPPGLIGPGQAALPLPGWRG